jgi:hypothetical protein
MASELRSKLISFETGGVDCLCNPAVPRVASPDHCTPVAFPSHHLDDEAKGIERDVSIFRVGGDPTGAGWF